jgi:predicted ATPase/DNA-binding SARP family transcriptional activator
MSTSMPEDSGAGVSDNRAMRFGILGPTQVWREDGSTLPVGGPRVRALLARLLLDAGRIVAAERLIDDLYGEAPPAGAANALQSQVSRLRRSLADLSQVSPPPAHHPRLELHPAGYRLAVDRDDVDAHRFARLAASGHRALAAGDHPAAVALLREAIELWRGPALADVADAPFAAAHAVRLEEGRLAAVTDRIEADLALGEHASLVPELQQLVEAHPLRERIRGQLMRALYGSGRQAEALGAYEDARRRLAEELGADPSTELAAIHRAVLRADESLAVTTPTHRLPAQLTSFVGRDEELRRVGKLLGEARLVTITGPGGAGKTRLAVEAAGRDAGESCLVELAPLGAGADVPQAVLAALGLRDGGLRAATDSRLTATDRLVAALADRRLLLVLDNCEHVVAGAAGLASRLLGACPQLRILATSREALGLTGEALCPLSGLALPPTDVDDITGPAVRLFADRAADVLPGFIVDGTNSGAVLQICRSLDGLPLAIELAAARLRSLPVSEIAARLGDRFALLSRGSRTAQPRHRTLRAVVEWSWDLLDEPERMLARRLTVFADGATLAAAEQVTGLDGDTVDLLTSLVDKSLVEVANNRYRMLDTIRAFGAERLAEAGETERLRRAHAAYFLDLAWTADPHLRRAEQREWLARLDAERDNFHTAIRAAIAGGDEHTALQLVAALSSYWWLRGLRSEAALLAGEVLAAVGPRPAVDHDEEYTLCVLNAALGGAGHPHLTGGLEPPHSLMHRLRRPRQPALFLLSAMASGPPEVDEDLVAMTEHWQRQLGDDPWTLALGSMGMGYVWLWHGQVAEAEPLFAEALDDYRAIGERWGMTNALAALAEVADLRGDRTRSIALIDEALRLAGELDSPADTADLLRLRGDGGLRAGDFEAAGADYQRAASYARKAGAPDLLAAARYGSAEVVRLQGDLTEARRLAEAALVDCPAGWFTVDATRSELLIALGRIAEAEGDVDTARERYRGALAIASGVAGIRASAAAQEGLDRLATS